MTKKLETAVIGYGYWGKNITRALMQCDGFRVATICDLSAKNLEKAANLYPAAQLVTDYREIPDSVQVVAIVTPLTMHFSLAKHFLERGKNTLISKPFARTLGETEQLLAIADKNDVAALADYTFVFNPAVQKLKQLLPKIGKPQFVLSQRLNLGIYQPDINVVVDLIPHDLSILCYLFDGTVKKSVGHGYAAMGQPQEDVAYAHLEMDNGLLGLVTVSWLSPFKVRQFIIIGTEGMLSYDDNEVAEKVKLYDRGISVPDLLAGKSDRAYNSRISYRSGDLIAPAIPNLEALSIEMEEFHQAITDREVRRRHNELNLRVMRSLTVVEAGMAGAIPSAPARR